VQRVAPLARVWMFLLPVYITWSTAGLLGLGKVAIPAKLHRQANVLVFLAAVSIPGVLLIVTVPRTASIRSAPGAEEGITRYLQDKFQPGDSVVVKSPISTPLQYYFQEYGLPLDSFNYQTTDIQKLWVVVSRRYDQTVESVLGRRGLEEYNQAAPANATYQYKHISVYELTP
jgi:hypothetical protein